MIVVPIVQGQREALESLLASMNLSPGRVDPYNSLIPFARFDTLHCAKLVIIEATNAEEIRAYGWEPHEWPVSLGLIGEIDGSRDHFMATLCVMAKPGLEKILGHCEGFDSHKGSLLEFLMAHQQDSAAEYVNWIGRTVTQVHEELALQRSLSEALPSIIKTVGRENVRTIRQHLMTHVEHELHQGRLTLTPEAATAWPVKFKRLVDLVGLPLLLLVLSPLLLLITPFVLLRFRQLEKQDPKISGRPDPSHSQSLSRIEDFDVTNQFNVFGDVKPGLFRLWLAKFILRLVDYFSRHVYHRGFLARIRTIHFARWTFLNNERSLYFSSVYDGSLESYMDDFVNKVAFGLNLTFGLGVGYPRTRWLIKGGAENEQTFKSTLRRHQFPSEVWYRAHPGLTAFDMARNARIRQGVEKYPRNDDAIRDWLSEI